MYIENKKIFSTNEDFALNISGYSSIALIDLSDTKEQTSNIISNTSITVDSVVTPKHDQDDNAISFHCDINFDLDFSLELPDFLKRPYPNLTLFKKVDEFSWEISKLNDTLIQIFHEMNCCGISDEYNKTVVPIFRYLASTEDHKDCGDSPSLPKDSCGPSGGLLKPILKAVEDITVIYTAIEPIFCFISPIPGNPWLPIDFNWTMAIKPYLQSFQSFMDFIMSGTLFDIVIDPVKNLNRMLQNCTQSQSTNTIANIDNNSRDLIKLMEDYDNTKTKLDNNLNSKKEVSTQTKEFKKAQKELLYEKKRYSILKQTISKNKYQSFKITNNFSEVSFDLANIRNPGDGICMCLLRTLDIEVRVPKIPSTKIRVLPENTTEVDSRFNDLLKIRNEEAYSIKYKDIFKSSAVKEVNLDRVMFTGDAITDMYFINAFKKFIISDSSSTSGYKYETVVNVFDNSAINAVSGIPIETKDFIQKLSKNLPKLRFYYTDKSEYLKKTISDYNPTFPPKESLTTEEILDTNRKFITKIKELEKTEFNIYNKLNDIFSKDKENWLSLKLKADTEFRKLKQQQKESNNIGNLDTGINTNITNIKTQELYQDFFGSYHPIDISYDINDERIYTIFINYYDLRDTTMYSYVLEYLNKRISLFGFSSLDEDYKTSVSKEITQRGNELKDIFRNNNLIFDNTLSVEDRNNQINNKINDLKTTDKVNSYINDITQFMNTPFGSYFLEKLDTFAKKKNELLLHINEYFLISDISLIDSLVDDITSKLPVDNNPSAQQDNILALNIKLLQIEQYKLNLFKILEDNVAYSFYLSHYPRVPCTCDNLVCSLLQIVIQYILQYINKMIGYILQLVLEYLIPKWLRALIDLIIYKLKCILEIVYMKQNIDLIKKVSEDVLQSLKNRVSSYPYDGCVNKALDKALQEIKNQQKEKNLITGETDGTGTGTSAEDELLKHDVKITFVDFNKRDISLINKAHFNEVSLKVEVDIGATIKYVHLIDSTIPGNSTLTSLEIPETKNNVFYIPNLPLDKIVSGKLKAIVKSFKPTAEVKEKFDEATLVVTDFINSKEMQLILQDYVTFDRNIFKEENKETLLISFSVVPNLEVGNPIDNFILLTSYIKEIVLLDKVPFGSDIEALPPKKLDISTIIKDSSFSYKKENNLFSFLVNCNNFFPKGRKIYCEITTFEIYNNMSMNVSDDIYCQPSSKVLSLDNFIEPDFTDTIIYSNNITIPFEDQVKKGKEKSPGDINNIVVRDTSPVVYDCSALDSSSKGTSFLITKLNNDLKDSWKDLGLI